MQKLLAHIARGFTFVRANPQVGYTFFLIVAIPAAFLYTGERFLGVTRNTQNIFEQERVKIFQDAVAGFAEESLQNSSLLKNKLTTIQQQNLSIISILIVSPEKNGTYPIIISIPDILTVWEPDTLTSLLIQNAKGEKSGESNSFLGERYVKGERSWEAVRALKNKDGLLLGYIYTVVSMSRMDSITSKGIDSAYITLFIIIIAVFILLLRHARIIDYAVLYRKLEEVDKMKDDIVSMAAHELRSPLTIIRAYIDILRDEKNLTEYARSTLENIERNIVTLTTLISDILDVARLQGGRMSFTPTVFNPSILITEVAESFEKNAQNGGLKLITAISELQHINVDSNRLRQILVNLVGNAVKYTPKGEVRVIASCERGFLEIRVSDTGMGISHEDQVQLFEKFYRIKNEETKLITGTGLGLWITREMVNQMKGTISVESIKGKGTDFIVKFPVVR